MKHLAAVAAVVTMGWLMMMPPPKMPPRKDAHGNFEVNLSVPVTRWLVFATYRNEAACRADLAGKPSYFMCVDSADVEPKAAATAAKK